MSRPRESSLVFNIVWTGDVFHYLRYFVCSLIEQSTAQFRFVANGCAPGSLAAMDAFGHQHPDRVAEIVDVSPDTMVAHGVALDAIRRQRDDGDHFCLVDADIKANAPFVDLFLARLETDDAVTSGKEVWTDDNTRPADHPGVGGRHFYDVDGFVFGSPHLALYRRGPLEETAERWGVGLGSAGPELRDDTKARLREAGRSFLVYDTGKILNILLQLDGHRLSHVEHPDLIHIGGLSHYLAPPAWVERDGVREPDWAQMQGIEARFEVARFTATMLSELVEGQPAPSVPAGLDPSMTARLELVRREMIDLVDSYRSC